MQFNFDCEQVLGCNNEGLSILEGSFPKAIKPGHMLYVNEILDIMGHLSSKGLNTIITTSHKFFSSNHRIFIKAKNNTVIGYLKVGVKKLFVRDQFANYYEISPLCVLDFYIHETQQRGGHGKGVFDYMVNFENIEPKLLAYDRPSPKLIAFLKKHFQLTSYVSQNNNYVVFNDYFEHLNAEKKNNRNGRGIKFDNSDKHISNNRSNFANIGQNLVHSSYSNSTNTREDNGFEYKNNTNHNLIINQNSNSNRSPYPNQNNGFSNYFLNEKNTNYYDQIYSKKKLQLLNDFIQKKNLDRDEYVKEQLNFREKETLLAQERVKQLESNIDPNSNNFYDYNKRNEYKTIFDDKKLLVKRQFNFTSPPETSSKVIGITGLSNLNGIKTNVLPTTSLTYGAYYNNNFNNDYKKKIFY